MAERPGFEPEHAESKSLYPNPLKVLTDYLAKTALFALRRRDFGRGIPCSCGTIGTEQRLHIEHVECGRRNHRH